MSVISPKTIVITAYPGKQGTVTMQKADFSVLEPVDPYSYDSGGPKKRRRLTHLTQDEKLLRRKLKNRVAAQTARDRKKALMTDLEEKVADLEDENKLLRKQNDALRVSSQTLVDENKSLRSRLSGESLPEAGTESEASRSAAPAPLQKEQAQILSQLMVQYFTFVVTLSMIMSSAYSTKSQISAVTAARKRKQPHPLRRALPNSVATPHPEVIHQEWWGSHQRSWNPSMN